MTSHVRIAPSILAADFARLGDEVARIAPYTDILHVDVMDGHFVPNISLGPPVIASLRSATELYLDCHLMISDPVRYLEALAGAGANGATAHIEAVPNPESFFDEAARLGIDAGLVINPPTPAESVIPYLDRCSIVLVMSVNPGFGGQSFIDEVLPKIRKLRESIDSSSTGTDIEVDGGIDLRTAGRVCEAGADILVAGTAVFGAADPVAAITDIRTIIETSREQ
jgi:ribulose-phosphate 3-epimerase